MRKILKKYISTILLSVFFVSVLTGYAKEPAELPSYNELTEGLFTENAFSEELSQTAFEQAVNSQIGKAETIFQSLDSQCYLLNRYGTGLVRNNLCDPEVQNQAFTALAAEYPNITVGDFSEKSLFFLSSMLSASESTLDNGAQAGLRIASLQLHEDPVNEQDVILLGDWLIEKGYLTSEEGLAAYNNYKAAYEKKQKDWYQTQYDAYYVSLIESAKEEIAVKLAEKEKEAQLKKLQEEIQEEVRKDIRERVDEEIAEEKAEEARRKAEEEAAQNAYEEENYGYSDGDVWIPATGEKYHIIPNCGRMNPNRATRVRRSTAESWGYDACKKCF